MKVLQHHAELFEYEPIKKEIPQAEEAEKKRYTFKDLVVLFIAIEEKDNENVVRNAVDELNKGLRDLKVNKVLLYPYAHLSTNLAKPNVALKLIDIMEKEFKKSGVEIFRAPFGWNKSFTLKIKSHPLAEQSKTFSSEGMKKEIKIVTRKKEAPSEPKTLMENDHRILGKKLDLFSFQEEGPGMVFFHSKGMILRNVLIDFWIKEHQKRGYQEINTPILLKRNIWEKSGHLDHYKDNMFFTEVEDMDFALKPMNCPGAILVYKNTTRSYRELPLRLAELGTVSRNELSGVLSGLFRLRVFTQDDAHIFVAPEQLEDEILNVAKLIDHFYKKFGFKYRVELSTMPDNAMGSKEIWNKAENALKHALEKMKMDFKINPKEGAFYGPKIDFHVEDSLKRSWQLATVQVDFQMPERFDLKYVGKDDKFHTPVIIHRVIYGAIERFIGILVEHYNGEFPVWLAPVQVKVLTISDKHVNFAKEVLEKLLSKGVRAEGDFDSATVEHKVRNTQIQKIPFCVVIGDKEIVNETLAVRTLDGKVEYGVSMKDFLEEFQGV